MGAGIVRDINLLEEIEQELDRAPSLRRRNGRNPGWRALFSGCDAGLSAEAVLAAGFGRAGDLSGAERGRKRGLRFASAHCGQRRSVAARRRCRGDGGLGPGYGLFDGLVPQTCARRSSERDSHQNARTLINDGHKGGGDIASLCFVLTWCPRAERGCRRPQPMVLDHRRPDHTPAESGAALRSPHRTITTRGGSSSKSNAAEGGGTQSAAADEAVALQVGQSGAIPPARIAAGESRLAR
jgi:hypothetical protein